MSELTTTVKNDLNTYSLQTLELTSKTNIRTLRLCVRFKYASFYQPFQSFQSLFGSLFESISIDYKTLEHWSWIVSYFQNISKTCHRAPNINIYPKYAPFVCILQASFYRRFRSFRSLFELIYFNPLQNTGAKWFCICVAVKGHFIHCSFAIFIYSEMKKVLSKYYTLAKCCY